MSVITVEQAIYTQHTAEILKGVSFSVPKAQLTMLIGPNGAGKTTVFNAIVSDIDLTSGEICFNGKPLTEWSAQTRATHMAFLPQINTLNFPYRVQEVVALGRIPHATGYEKDNEIILSAMRLMDISHLANKNYLTLSGGEQQRTQLARVFAQLMPFSHESSQGSKLLLLDEPSSALDINHQKVLMKIIKEVTQKGIAVLMISHDINTALRYADTIIALKQGVVYAQGAVHDVATKPVLESIFNTSIEMLHHKTLGRNVILP